MNKPDYDLLTLIIQGKVPYLPNGSPLKVVSMYLEVN